MGVAQVGISCEMSLFTNNWKAGLEENPGMKLLPESIAGRRQNYL